MVWMAIVNPDTPLWWAYNDFMGSSGALTRTFRGLRYFAFVKHCNGDLVIQRVGVNWEKTFGNRKG